MFYLGDLITLYNDAMDNGNALTEGMLFADSPLPTILIIMSYIYFVRNLGPKFMKNRNAFNLKYIIIGYNILQIIVNTYIFSFGLKMWITYNGWGFKCMSLDQQELEPGDFKKVARLLHLYFINKIFDLFDTVFFVLRKKERHISLFHVFHHSIMPPACWTAVKFNPGDNILFLGLPNTFVHIWMYSYYLLAVLGPKYQIYTWWSKYLTRLQLSQFFIIAIYFSYISYKCNVNRYFLTSIFVVDAICILLFLNFYFKEYFNKKKKTEKTC